MDGVRAIADPVRRQVLELLHVSPLPAGRIAEHFPISRPAISKHLRVLIECGAVVVTQTGRQRFYGLRTEPFTELVAYLEDLITPVFTQQLDALSTEVTRTRHERQRAASTPRHIHDGDENGKRSA